MGSSSARLHYYFAEIILIVVCFVFGCRGPQGDTLFFLGLCSFALIFLGTPVKVLSLTVALIECTGE